MAIIVAAVGGIYVGALLTYWWMKWLVDDAEREVERSTKAIAELEAWIAVQEWSANG